MANVPENTTFSAQSLMDSAFPAAFPPSPVQTEVPDTITDYLVNQQASFAEEPFNELDALVMSILVYLQFEDVDFADVYGADPVPLVDILRFCDFKHLISSCWMKNGDDIAPFVEAFVRNRRFGRLGACLYQTEESENVDKQFAAITFVQPGMDAFVAFRGTDGSVKGWKEDFELAYKEIIPSQRSATRYLSGVLSCLPSDQLLRLGGHSKGGNLAEYSAALIDEAGYERIVAIYNHDGPNFLNDPSPRYATEDYQAKRHKIVPQSSIFGMILEYGDNHRYVESTTVSFFQHRPTTWLVSGNDFRYVDDLAGHAALFDGTLDAWLHSCTPEQRDAFLGLCFDLVEQTNCKSWKEFQQKFPSNMRTILMNARDVDDATKEAVRETFVHLGGVIKTTATDRISKIARGFFSAD